MRERLLRRSRNIALAVAFATLAGAWALAQTPATYEVEGRKSGYLFNTPGTRTLQDDDFQNPGMFAVERGRDLWNKPEGTDGKSCASCHGEAEASMTGVATRYPVFDSASNGLMNLEMRINRERAERLKAAPLAYESDDLLALTAFISNQSRGQPMAVAVDGPAQPFFEDGKKFYDARRGQLDLSCAQCHEDRVGQHLRGDIISQGQLNGFPIHRLSWRAMLSRHRIFAWCNTSVRAEPYPLGSPEYLALELYVAWRGRGLPIETPAVRR